MRDYGRAGTRTCIVFMERIRLYRLLCRDLRAFVWKARCILIEDADCLRGNPVS